MRNIIFIIVICLLTCTTQPTTFKKWFQDNPDGVVNYGSIYEYMNNFRTDDINVARNAYLTVLAFIKEVIDATHENLARAERMDSLTVKRPALKNGELAIIESIEMTTPTTIWNDVQMEFAEIAFINVIWEFTLIIEYSKQYNNLLDHWYSLTGEYLGEHIDIVFLYEKLIIDIQHLL